MKVGKMYKFVGPGLRISGLDGVIALYLGEDQSTYADDCFDLNHRILKLGAPKSTLIDHGLLKYMKEVAA